MPRQVSARTRSALAVAGWIAAAAVATTVGVVAVSAIGTDIVGETARPLSHDEVTRALATARPAATPTASAGSGAGVTKVLGTPGGTIVARCADGVVTLVSWSPAQGFEADDVHADGRREATLKFESDNREVRVRVDCRVGVPTPHVRTKSDD